MISHKIFLAFFLYGTTSKLLCVLADPDPDPDPFVASTKYHRISNNEKPHSTEDEDKINQIEIISSPAHLVVPMMESQGTHKGIVFQSMNLKKDPDLKHQLRLDPVHGSERSKNVIRTHRQDSPPEEEAGETTTTAPEETSTTAPDETVTTAPEETSDAPNAPELNINNQAKNNSLNPRTDDPDGPKYDVDEAINLYPTSLSHKVAQMLCHKIQPVGTKKPNKEYVDYLWTPIKQYVPELKRGFSLAPPVFTPDCMKWVFKPCVGIAKYPLMYPCVYWVPMPLKTSRCLFTPSKSHWLYVDYRPAEYDSTKNCPCKWPCISHFDSMQRCKIPKFSMDNDNGIDEQSLFDPLKEFDQINSMGFPIKDNLIISHHEALLLCRGIRRNFRNEMFPPTSPVQIREIPFRIKGLNGKKNVKDDPDKCMAWEMRACVVEDDEFGHGGGGDDGHGGPGKEHDLPVEGEKGRSFGQSKSKPKKKKSHKSKRSPKEVSEGTESHLQGPGGPEDDDPSHGGDNDQEETCWTWNKFPLNPGECQQEIVSDKVLNSSKSIPSCPGGWPCNLDQKNQKNSSSISILDKGPDCPCNWPCLPFFESMNKCFSPDGLLLVDDRGRNYVPSSKYFIANINSTVQCLSYLGNDEIECTVSK